MLLKEAEMYSSFFSKEQSKYMTEGFTLLFGKGTGKLWVGKHTIIVRWDNNCTQSHMTVLDK